MKFGRFCLAAAVALTAVCINPRPASAEDCFDVASRYQGVNVNILRAIAIRENRRCDSTIAHNTNGSVDVGCMQINSVHFPELANYGVAPRELMDQCKNVFVGAWHYKKMVRKYGNTWAAVGAYHSETPALRDKYAQEVQQILRRYGVQ